MSEIPEIPEIPEIRHHFRLTDDELRFMVLHRQNERTVIDAFGKRASDLDDGDPVYEFHGGANRPTLFKTMRMALKAARDRWTWIKKERTGPPRVHGKILLFDPNYLPVIADDNEVRDHPGLTDRLSDVEFCERQTQLWAQQAQKAKLREKPLVVRCGVEGCRLSPNHDGLHAFGPNIP